MPLHTERFAVGRFLVYTSAGGTGRTGHPVFRHSSCHGRCRWYTAATTGRFGQSNILEGGVMETQFEAAPVSVVAAGIQPPKQVVHLKLRDASRPLCQRFVAAGWRRVTSDATCQECLRVADAGRYA